MAEDVFARAAENKLLASIPRDELSRLLARSSIVRLEFRAVLVKRGDAIRHVFFPLSGLYSLLAPTANSDTVEVGTIGREFTSGLIRLTQPRSPRCRARPSGSTPKPTARR
jgi:CRP-like cAMP-binding protein